MHKTQSISVTYFQSSSLPLTSLPNPDAGFEASRLDGPTSQSSLCRLFFWIFAGGGTFLAKGISEMVARDDGTRLDGDY